MNLNVGKWIAGAATDLIDSIGKNVDRFVTSKEEKEQLKQAVKESVQQHQENLQQELTKRHETDMNSDSWLSKNIRPLVLASLLCVFFTAAFTDGNLGWLIEGFKIEDQYIQLMGQMALTAFSFYFGSRGAEKIMKLIQDRKQNQNQKNGTTE